MQIFTLLDAVTANTTGSPVAVQRGRTVYGSIPIQISGITNAGVRLEGTIATQREVDENTAVWETIENAQWTADVLDGLFTAVPYVRAVVSGYVAGTITVRIAI